MRSFPETFPYMSFCLLTISYASPKLVRKLSSRRKIERFSFECCKTKTKTKTKVITLANHKEHRQYSEPIKTRSNYM